MFCFLFCVFCVFVLFCVLFLIMYIIVYFLYVYNFTDHCHRVDIQLQLINIISHHISDIKSYYIVYHIISHHIIYHIVYHIIYPCASIVPSVLSHLFTTLGVHSSATDTIV
jgi:hypothetical protein